ncbi:isochorismatase family protein [Pseudomonas sp. NPDC089734]|uniref:isochorismatase family protein n=1 Tax=Pseudomonas sp. NPDC089734 TaxID=3364469 RepID=UPI00382B0068
MTIARIADYPMPTVSDFPANRVDWKVDPERCMLLVHDMQEYFLAFFEQDGDLLARLKAHCARLCQWARDNGVPVVYSAQPQVQPAERRGLLTPMWGPGITAANTEQQFIAFELSPGPDDIVIQKWRYSAFRHSNLENIMREQHRDQLLICGVYAHIGCMATALDAFMLDIQAFVAGDCMADFSERSHHQALSQVADCCGTVVSLEQVLNAGNDLLSREGLLRHLNILTASTGQTLDLDANLMDYGLDSLQVMNLISVWNEAGIRVRLEDILQKPTFNGWWDTLSRARNASCVLAEVTP